MASGLQKLITSEEDDDEEMEMDVKEEDDGDEEDDEDGEKHVDAAQMMVGVDGEMPTRSNNNNRFQQHHQFQEQVGTPGGGGARRCRPIEEKERTKLRERQRRAITARILAGLRRHGNYNLRVRADINDVIAALAREAGWVVLPDGTTFPSKSQGARLAGVNSAPVTSSSQMVSPHTPASLKGGTSSYQSPGELNACNIKGVYLPSLSPYDLPSSARSQSSSLVGEGACQTESHPLIGGSMDNIGDKQIVDIPLKLQERDFSSTANIPVYIMLPLGVINMKCELVDPDGLLKQLRVSLPLSLSLSVSHHLKSLSNNSGYFFVRIRPTLSSSLYIPNPLPLLFSFLSHFHLSLSLPLSPTAPIPSSTSSHYTLLLLYDQNLAYKTPKCIGHEVIILTNLTTFSKTNHYPLSRPRKYYYPSIVSPSISGHIARFQRFPKSVCVFVCVMNRASPEMLNCMNAPGTFIAGNCTDMTVMEKQRDLMKWQQSDFHDQQIQYNFGGSEHSGVFSLPIHAQGFHGFLGGNPAVKPDPSSENRWVELGFGSCGLVMNNNGTAGLEERGNVLNNNISRTFSCSPTVAAENKSSDTVLSQKLSLPAGKESSKKRKADKVQSNKAATAESDSTEKRMKSCAEEGDSKITEQISTKNNDKESSADTSKDNSKASEVQKLDYIHVRARRGQATDSHSLAERVRREKISERMKYLQDLVPGCNKITGKAGMLDEIINYVQSLQRQVEFLSMKLAAVNPRLHFNIDDLFAKEMLPTCAANFQTIGMSSEMTNSAYLQLNPMQQLASCGLDMGLNSTDLALQRTIRAPGSIPEPFLDTSCFTQAQPTATWDADLQNIFNVEFQQGRSSFQSQPFTGSIEGSNLKMEM